jgi:hypothetical protein
MTIHNLGIKNKYRISVKYIKDGNKFHGQFNKKGSKIAFKWRDAIIASIFKVF